MSTSNQRDLLFPVLRLCQELFQPENAALYVGDNEQGVMQRQLTGIPARFPQSFQEMQDFSGQVYSLMPKLGLPGEYLAYPNFDEFMTRLDRLNFCECAQFLLFYMRMNLKYGQEMYYRLWREGKALTVVERMLELAEEA